MRLNSPQINIITKACMKASRSLIRDFGEIENLQVYSSTKNDLGAGGKYPRLKSFSVFWGAGFISEVGLVMLPGFAAE